MTKKSVEDIWAELNKGSGRDAKFDQLWKTMNNNTDVVLKKSPRGRGAAPVEGDAPMASSSAALAAPSGVAEGGDAARAGEVATSRLYNTIEDITQATARDVNAIADENAGTRKRALAKIQAAVLGANRPSDALLQQAAEDVLVKPLLRRLDDPVEKCRELAAGIITSLLQEVPDAVHYLLPYLMPVLGERLCLLGEEGRGGFAEPSEEIRLIHMKLLRFLIEQSQHSITRYTADCEGMIMNCCRDEYPDLLIETCRAQDVLTAIVDKRLQPVAKQVVAAFAPLMAHRRHRVRVACLETLRTLMMCGAHEMILEISSFRDPNLVSVKEFYGEGETKMNFLGRLASDKNTQVREQFVRTLDTWMTEMVERLDHEVRLLPYVVSAVHDDAPSVQNLAMALLDKLGTQYEKENLSHIKDTLDYLPEEISTEVLVYGPNGAAAVLPPPFTARPNYGSRINCLGVFSKLHTVMVKEVEQVFNEEHRVRAMKLINTFLVFCEENATQHLHKLLPPLAAACRVPSLRPHVMEGARLMGVFCTPDALLEVLLSFAGAANDTSVRANTLAMLGGLLVGARVHPYRWRPHLRRLCDVVADPDLLKSADGMLAEAALNFVEGIVGLLEALDHTAEPPEPAVQPRRVLKNDHKSLPPLPPMGPDEAEPVLLRCLIYVRGRRDLEPAAGAAAARLAAARGRPGPREQLVALRGELLASLDLAGSEHVHADVAYLVRCLEGPEACGEADVTAVAAVTAGGLAEVAGTSLGAALLTGVLEFVRGVPSAALMGASGILLPAVLSTPCLSGDGAVAAVESAICAVRAAGAAGAAEAAAAAGVVAAALEPLCTCIRGEDTGAREAACRLLLASLEAAGGAAPPALATFALEEGATRLDDASDAVRGAACCVLRALVTRVASVGPEGEELVGKVVAAVAARVRSTEGVEEDEAPGEEAFQGSLAELLATAARPHPGVVARRVEELEAAARALPAFAGLGL